MSGLGSVFSIIEEVLRRVREGEKMDRRTLLARLREAKKIAIETGDTSALEKLRDDLVRGR